MDKICPLRISGGQEIGKSQYCLKEKCAWWNKDEKECCILALSEPFKPENVNKNK